MLVDITFHPFEQQYLNYFRSVAENHNLQYPLDPMDLEPKHPKRLAQGIYHADGNLSIRSIVENVVEDLPDYITRDRQFVSDPLGHYLENFDKWKRKMNKLYSEKYKRGPFRNFYSLGAYGLCDTPEQFLADYPHFQDDDVPRFITFNGIARKHQPSSGGFRYHKHGTYVGKQRPRHEYLYHDTHINYICSFHIYRVEGDNSG